MDRKCEICNIEMIEGYIHEELGVYYCSEEHLDQQWNGIVSVLQAMSEDELEESVIYWTDWSDEI